MTTQLQQQQHQFRILNNHQTALSLFKDLTSSTTQQTFPHIKKSLETLHSAFRLYGHENLCVAFNGGKDATVALYLTLAALSNYSCETGIKLHCIYLDDSDNFQQVNQFVNQTVKQVHEILECESVHMSILEGIDKFIKNRNGVCCAFVMGSRRTDPYSLLMDRFEPSSNDWPPLMRVNPILDWSYSTIWEFLIHFKIPFCSLYTQGYTSLGSISTTFRNPALKITNDDDDDDVTYKPAWKLVDDNLERAGRINKNNQIKNDNSLPNT